MPELRDGFGVGVEGLAQSSDALRGDGEYIETAEPPHRHLC